MIFPDWPAAASVKAVTTTRRGGVSQAPWAERNLADHVGDAADAVAENRRRLQQSLNLPGPPLWLDQVHGKSVINAASALLRDRQADASFSLQPKVVCAVLTADCLPVLFCDRHATRVAAAHAGWRGLAGGVLEATIEALQCPPADLLAWLGPAIGPQHFEVGSEVRDAFTHQHPQAQRAFTACANGRWLADLYLLARIRLSAAGVDAVYGGGFCTYSEPERFYSYRRERTTGRLASLIWLD